MSNYSGHCNTHGDSSSCQDAFVTNGQPFADIDQCVKHWIPLYRDCYRFTKEAVFRPILSHVNAAYRRDMLVDTTGDDPDSVRAMIAAAWEAA